MILRRLLVVLSLLVSITAVLAPPASAADLNTPTSSMAVAGGRGFLLHVPPGLTLPAPVVIALHGRNGTPTDWNTTWHLDSAADKDGFVEVIATGIGLTWNAEICCDPARADNVNDAQYVKDIRSELITAGIADPDRVFTLGYSNGDMLGLLLQCQYPHLFAAHAGSAGNFPRATPTSCSGADVLHFHGYNDVTVPFNGGYNAALDMTTQPIPTIADRMVGASVRTHYAYAGHGFPAKDTWGFDGVAEAWRFFAQVAP